MEKDTTLLHVSWLWPSSGMRTNCVLRSNIMTCCWMTHKKSKNLTLTAIIVVINNFIIQRKWLLNPLLTTIFSLVSYTHLKEEKDPHWTQERRVQISEAQRENIVSNHYNITLKTSSMHQRAKESTEHRDRTLWPAGSRLCLPARLRHWAGACSTSRGRTWSNPKKEGNIWDFYHIHKVSKRPEQWFKCGDPLQP